MNKYGTKSYEEIRVIDYSEMTKAYFDTLSKYDDISAKSITNKKILIFNLMPLHSYLNLANKVTVVTTNKKLSDECTNKYCNCNVILLSDLKELEYKLNHYVDMNSLDYIFANPPYDGDLYLDIAETLLPYINENGTMNILGPMQCIQTPAPHEYKFIHQQLFSHIKSYKIMDPKYYYLFDSFKGYTDLGIIRYVKEDRQFNIHTAWREYHNKELVALYDKILNSNITKISDVIEKRADKGIIVPIGRIGGTKRYAVYNDFLLYDNGKCYVMKKENKNSGKTLQIIPISKCDAKGIENGKIVQGIRMKSVDQAIKFHKKYRNNYILKGLFGLSLCGSQNPQWNVVPYFSMENEIDNKYIVDALKLNKTDLNILACLGKKDGMSKLKIDHTEKVF